MAKWKTTTIWIVMITLLASVVFANKCEEVLTPGQECLMMTPPISCSTYKLYDSDAGTNILNGTMTLVQDNIYKFTFNQSTGSYIVALCDNSTVREIIVKGVDDMGSLSITLFVMAVTAVFFILPFKKLNKNALLDWLFKRISITTGIFLLALDTAMLSTIADNAGINLTTELFFFLWAIMWCGALFFGYTLIAFFFRILANWKQTKHEKRMGGVM